MIYKFLLLFILSTSVAYANKVQTIDSSALRSGDLIFQNLDCGGLCDAIEAVTPAFDGEHFSHIGIIYKKENRFWVIEAIGKGVQLTPLKKVLKRSDNNVFIGRLQCKDTGMVAKIIQFSLKQVGVPYDNDFRYNNGKFYCSELVYDAFKAANNGKPFFRLFPMTFKKPGESTYFPVWINYFSKLKEAIPEGEPGCNPGGIAISGKLTMLLLKSNSN